MLLPAIRDSAEAAWVANKIVSTLSAAYQISGEEVVVTPSIGIAVFPADGESLDTLIRNADAAMYHAKAMGRGTYQFFAPEMNACVTERLSLSNQLRQAVRRTELRLLYQPQFRVDTGALIGVEALLRWQHPSRGLLPPDVFIPVAEESDLIVALGTWVLQEACRQMAEWQQAGLATVPLAVNVSSAQFRSGRLVDSVRRALAGSGVEPGLLEIELTETTVMHDVDAATATLRNLRALGIRIAIDDFGTGYSSLGYLRRFPIDKLKIDRSFVLDLPAEQDAAAIVRAIIDLARSLRLDVVAEGVETSAQLEFLRAQNCSGYQGFVGSRPVEPDAMARVLGSPR